MPSRDSRAGGRRAVTARGGEGKRFVRRERFSSSLCDGLGEVGLYKVGGRWGKEMERERASLSLWRDSCLFNDDRVTWAFYTRSLDIETEQRGRSHNDRSGVVATESVNYPGPHRHRHHRQDLSITSDNNPWPRKCVPEVVHATLPEQSPPPLR